MKLNSMFKLVMSISVLVTGLNLANTPVAQASERLIFATPPTQSTEETLSNFQPLVDYLSKVTNREIVIKPAKNYFDYSRNMREDKYDLVFDGAHFIDYRMTKLQHSVLVKQPGDLRFVVVVKKDSGIKTLNDLVTKKVCAPNIPHLATLAFLELYPNPSRQPEMLPVQSFKAGLQCVQNNKGAATIVRDKFLAKMVKNKDDYQVIYTTERKLPARGLTISPRVDTQTRARIAQALVDANGNQILTKAFATFGGSKFVFATEQDFAGLGDLLQVVWGFHI